MGLTSSNSGIFRAPGVIVSPVGKGERRKEEEKRESGRKEKGIEKEWKEGRKEGRRRNIKDWRKDKKEF